MTSLKAKAISGVKWIGMGSVVQGIGNLVLLAILTRLLDKADFGLFAIVSIVVGFSGEFVDMGISQAVVQKKEVSSKQLSSLYLINVTLGLLVGIAIWLFAPLIARFYEDVLLINLLKLMSLTFVFLSLGNQHQALFQRQMRFDIITKIQITSFCVYFFAVSFLAYQGYGVYSLIWGSIIKSISWSFLSIFNGLKIHRPSFYFNFKIIKSFLSYGSFRSGSFLISFLSRQADVLILGKLLPMEDLGVYDVLKKLVSQPIRLITPIIQKVTFPLMAKFQDNISKASEVYLRILKLLNVIRFPLLIAMILCAEGIIKIILGNSWISHVYIFQLFCLLVLFQTIHSFNGTIIIALGKADWGFYNNLVLLPIRIGLIYYCSQWGVIGVLVGLIFLMLVLIPILYELLVLPLLKISRSNYFIHILKPLILFSSTALIIALLIQQLNLPLIFSFSLNLSLFSVSSVILLYSFANTEFNIMMELIQSLKKEELKL